MNYIDGKYLAEFLHQSRQNEKKKNVWEFCQSMTLTVPLLLFWGCGRGTAAVHLTICCSTILLTQSLQLEKTHVFMLILLVTVKDRRWFHWTPRTWAMDATGNVLTLGDILWRAKEFSLKLHVVEDFLSSLPELLGVLKKNAFSQ